jgi:hypothetical protein
MRVKGQGTDSRMVTRVRERELAFLKKALGPRDGYEGVRVPSALFVWGPAGSGKSEVIEAAVEACTLNHVASVSAVEILCGRRPFLQTILQQLSPDAGTHSSDTLKAFVQHFKAAGR